MGKYKKLDKNKLQHKKLKKKQSNLPIKLENIYNKYSENKTNAIKKRKTIKKRNNLFLNKNKATKKKNKKTNLNNLKSIQRGGELGLTKSGYLKEIAQVHRSLVSLNTEFGSNITELMIQKDKLFKLYINPFKEDIDYILDKFANMGINFLETKESTESFTIMRKRMMILNKIFRFSPQVGQYIKKTKDKSKSSKTKHFYYKHRHKRYTKVLKTIFITRGKSKIKKEFYIDTLWSQIAVYREFELNVRRILVMIRLKQDNIKESQSRVHLQKKDLSAQPLKGSDTTLINFNKSFKKNLDIYNTFNGSEIHFYLKKMNVGNMSLLLLKIPKEKKVITTKIANFSKTIMRTQEEYKDDRGYDYTKAKGEGLVEKHLEANLKLIERCQITIDNFFEQIKEGELLTGDDISYLTNYKIINDLDDNFFKINNMFLFNLEKKPYLDMGQVSMLSYENKLTASLTNLNRSAATESIYNKDDTHREYFNNILHLPNFILKYLDISMLESAEKTYKDDYYNKINGDDISKLNDIITTNDVLKKNYDIKKSLVNVHTFNKEQLKLNSNVTRAYTGKATDLINKDNNSNEELINSSSDTTSDSTDYFFMPISTYHALFKIKNFDAIRKVELHTKFFDYGKNQLHFNNRENIGKGISKLFFINKYDDIIPGTILYLYKQIAFHLDFL
jgi:hypothetical protein